jgi:hypothetical protein
VNSENGGKLNRVKKMWSLLQQGITAALAAVRRNARG